MTKICRQYFFESLSPRQFHTLDKVPEEFGWMLSLASPR